MTGQSKGLYDWLKRANIVMDEQFVQRVVIDMKVDAAVKVYVEMLGTNDLIEVQPPDMSSAQVVVLGAKE
jgi:hypothetical protein